METLAQHHESIAALIARVFLGLLFFFQGYDAVFKIKISNVIETYESSFADKGIPRFLTVCGAWFTSYAELIGGLFLITGLFEYWSLSLLGLDLIVASIGFCIVSSIWDTRHVFPRLVLLIFLLVIPPAWDHYSLDHLLSIIYKN
ncbi:MAG: hypothetical protein JWP12_1217 [Bacteroidetes bacterium]|nr:hypothetical protein [Bacteroidota bacterium]